MRGLEGNMQAQPRVFAHDAVEVTASNTDSIANTEERGCCLYIGDAGATGTAVVKMESGNIAVFKGLPAGAFLPILVTQLLVDDGGSNTTDVTSVLALF